MSRRQIRTKVGQRVQRTNSRQSLYILAALFAVLIALALSVLMAHRTYAISNYSPDAGDYGGANSRYALENTPTAQGITSMSVPIYFRDNPGSVQVEAYDFYFWGYENDSRGSVPGARFNGGGAVRGNHTFSVSGFSYDGSMGLYKAVINVEMGPNSRWVGNMVNFRLRLASPTNGWIGYSPSSSGIFSTAAARPWGDGDRFANRRNQGVHNYRLPFAMPCSEQNNRGVTIRLRDMDSGNSDNNGVHMTFAIYNETRGHHIGYSTRGNASSSGADFFMDFTMEPLHKYRLEINGVSSQNTMQYNIPFDNISYATGCDWRVSGASEIKKANTSNLNVDSNWSGSNISATPGEHLYFKHTLKNEGPFTMDRRVAYGLYGSGFSNGAFNGRFGGGDAGPGASGSTFFRYGRVGSGGNGTGYTVYTVTQDDVGRDLCQYIRWLPTGLNNGGATQSGTRCANIPYNYTLTPRVTLDRDGVVEPDTPIAVTPIVENSGPTITRNSEWQISKLIVDKGVAVPRSTGGSSNTIPCAYYGLSGVDCTRERGGNSVFNTNGTRRSGDDYGGVTNIADDIEVGSRICFTLSIRARAHNDANWQHSAPICVVIGKKPKVQVTGGDIRVGVAATGQSTPSASMILTSQSIKGATTYGSWGEYGIAATGTVTGIGSGASLNNGLTGVTSICSYTMLTFTNAGGPTSGANATCNDTPSMVGRYRSLVSLPDVAAAFVVGTGTPELLGDAPDRTRITSDKFATLQNTYGTTTDLVLEGGEVPVGKTIVINAGARNVRIAGNLTYSNDEISDTDNVPQLVILANNILIEESVTQVDAWLIARGTVNTCANVPQASITSENCNQQLTVNGPTVARQLLLYRTAGSGTGDASGDPAEVFNLRSDAYIWALSRNKNSARLDTVYQRELPPRY